MAALTLDITVRPTLDVAAANKVTSALKLALGQQASDLQLIDPKEFERAADGAHELQEEIDLLRKRLEQVEEGGKRAGKAFDFNQTVEAVRNVAGSLNELAQPTIALDTATAQMRALGGEAIELAPKLREAALEMGSSGQFAQSAAELQATMTEALASGVKGGEEGLKRFASTAAKLATGGGSSIGAATKLIAGQLNAYGESAESAGRFSDIFFNTVNAGVTSVDELSSTLANVIPTAAGAGIEIENVGGALALMTQKGIPTAQSTNKLNQLLLELQKPAKDLEPILKKAGVSLESLKQDDLPTTLAKVKSALDSTGKSAVQVFSSSEASAAFQTLAGDLDGFRETFETVRDTAGSTDEAYGQMSDSIAVKTAQMQSQVESFVTKGLDMLGGGFLGVINAGTQVAPVLTSLSGIKDIVPDSVIQKIGKEGLSGALQLATGGAKALGTGIVNAGKSMIAFLASPAGIALAATTALVVGVIALRDALTETTEEKLESAEAEQKLVEQEKEATQSKIKQAEAARSMAREYRELATKAERTATEEKRMSDIHLKLQGQYPNLISSTNSLTQNLDGLQRIAATTTNEIAKLDAKMQALAVRQAGAAAQLQALKIQSSEESASTTLRDQVSNILNDAVDAIKILGRSTAQEAADDFMSYFGRRIGDSRNEEELQRNFTRVIEIVQAKGKVKVGFDSKPLTEFQQEALKVLEGLDAKGVVAVVGALGKVREETQALFDLRKSKVPDPIVTIPPPDTGGNDGNGDAHKREAQKFFADFTDIVTDGQRKVDDARLSIQLSGADNRLAALAIEYQRQITTINRQQDDQKTLVVTKVRETNEAYKKALAERKEGEPAPTITITGEKEALAKIEEVRDALVEATQGETASKFATELFAVNDADVARSIAAIERAQKVITGNSLAAIEQRGVLENQKIAMNQAEQLETFIATLPAYQAAVKPLFADALKAGTPEAISAAQVQAQAVADEYKRTNADVLAFQRAQAAERVKIERDAALAIAEARLLLIEDPAEREKATRLLEIQRTLNQELDLYEGSAQLQAAARIKAQAAVFDVEREHLRQQNDLVQAAASLQIGVQKALLDGTIAADTAATRVKLENIDKQKAALKEQLNQGLVGQARYISEVRRLAAEEHRIREEAGQTTLSIEVAVGKSVLAAATDFSEQKGLKIQAATDKLVELSKNGLELSAEAGAAQLQLLSQTGQQALSDLTAASAQMLIAGEFSLKQLGNVVLKSAFQLAQNEITILIPVIYAKAIGLLGPIAGAIAATAAIALVQGGLAYAQGAIKLKHGISRVPGDPRDGDSVPAILMPGERVVTTEVNRREYHTLEKLHRGATTDDIARDWWMEKYGRHFVAPDGSLQRMVSHQGAQIAELAGTVADVADTVAVLARAQETVARKYKKFQEVQVRGKMKVTRGQLIAVLEHGSNNEQSLR